MRQAGHDVTEATLVCPGRSDRHVVQIAQLKYRVVISEDKEFGDLAFRDGQFPMALIRIALPDLGSAEKAERLLDVVEMERERLVGHLIVIEPARVRTRPLL